MSIVSSIKPTSDEITERKPPTIEYSALKTIEAFKKEGFYNPDRLPVTVEQCNRMQRAFLSRVDESKGPVRRVITRMIRKIAIDYDDTKQKQKEYLTWTETWEGFYWTNRKLLARNIEGCYDEPVKVLRTKYNHIDNTYSGEYHLSKIRERYTIPFSKKNVIDAINSRPDTNLEDVKFCTFYQNTPGPSHNQYHCEVTYEQFINSSRDELTKVIRRAGGPFGLTINTNKPENKKEYIG